MLKQGDVQAGLSPLDGLHPPAKSGSGGDLSTGINGKSHCRSNCTNHSSKGVAVAVAGAAAAAAAAVVVIACQRRRCRGVGGRRHFLALAEKACRPHVYYCFFVFYPYSNWYTYCDFYSYSLPPPPLLLLLLPPRRRLLLLLLRCYHSMTLYHCDN